jgi:mycofactocin system transcriptional regulator
VGRVALQLFVDHGFDETTVEDIAAELGVGRRTVFRYFPSKNDMVWGDFDAVNARLRAELSAEDPSLPIIEAVTNAVVRSNRYPPELEDELRARITLITTVPTLQAHSMIRYADWRSVVVKYAAMRRHEDSPSIWSQTLGHVALASSMAAFSAWSRFDGELEELLMTTYGAVACGFRA